MRIKEGDEWKTAFRTRYGHFKYQGMPFRLSNTPASLGGFINKILVKNFDIFIIIYFDIIPIYTKDPKQDDIDNICLVVKQLRKYRLYTSLKKCYFHQDEV